jgi:hypothetical protein
METVLGERFWEHKKKQRSWEENWALYQDALKEQRNQDGQENDPFLSKQKGNAEIKALARWMSKMRKDAERLERNEKGKHVMTSKHRTQMEAVLGERFWEEKQKPGPKSSRRDDSVLERANYRRSLASEGFNCIGLVRSNPRVSFGARNKITI